MAASNVSVPREIVTPRLRLRPPAPGDGERINEAIRESFAELHAWMDWAREMPTVDDSEDFAAAAADRFDKREELPFLIFERDGGKLVGSTGLHRIVWEVPSFEAGYWCRTARVGRGYVTEATYGLARLAFETLGANRFEVRMDDRNVRSFRVAERLGLTLEGVLRNESVGTDDKLRNTRVYSALALEDIVAPRQPGTAAGGAQPR